MSQLKREVVDYKLPEGTHTSGIRRATAPQPHECPGCGSLADDPNPAHLVDETWIDCPRCGPSVDAEMTAEQRLSADVRDIFREGQARGSGRGGSGGGGGRRRSKPVARMNIRYEQEPVFFENGRSHDEVKTKRLETASERIEVQLTVDCKERLREISSNLRGDDGSPTPVVALIRMALKSHLLRMERPEPIPRKTPKASVYLQMYPSELKPLDIASEHFGLPRGVLIEACVEAWIASIIAQASEN